MASHARVQGAPNASAVQGAVAEGVPAVSKPAAPKDGGDASPLLVEENSVDSLPYLVPSLPTKSTTSSSSSDRALPNDASDAQSWVDPELQAFRANILREIGEGSIHTIETGFATKFYKEVVDEEDITNFLMDGERSGYSRQEKRWAGLPTAPLEDEELYKPVSTILVSIMGALGSLSARLRASVRCLVDSREAGFKVPEYAETCPDFSVKAKGPSFKEPTKESEYTEGVGFSNVATVIDVKTDASIAAKDEKEQAVDMAMYARQMLAQQPTRNYVRNLLVTETSARIFHFDRSGCWMTPLLNIHARPRTFTRWVVGLTSTNESVLGFDATITRSPIDPYSGARTSGTVEVDGVVFTLDSDEPAYTSMGISGRGTTCWKATNDKTKERVLIKDSWRLAGAVSEAELLKEAKGVDCMVQMVAHQDAVADTSAYWPKDFEGVRMRVKSRVVTQLWEKMLSDFKSRSQVIGAIHDALSGHRGLHEKGILHRDITLDNIRLGNALAPAGRRGALVGWGNATRKSSSNGAEHLEEPQRPNMFHSIAVLSRSRLAIKPPLDILDDIESFFYVILSVILVYKFPGLPFAQMEQNLRAWDEDDVDTIIKMKTSVILACVIQPQPWWGDACTTLVREYQRVLAPVVREKISIFANEELSEEEKAEMVGQVVAKYGGMHERVLEIVKAALEDVAKEEGTDSKIEETTIDVAPGTVGTKRRIMKGPGKSEWSAQKRPRVE